MGSSGGGSSKPPNDATPAGTITGYGKSTPFNPSFNSVLSNGMGWADVDEIDAANASNAQAASASAAQPAASTGGGYSEAALRQMLAQIMNPPNTPQQQAAMRIGMMPGAQGSYAGGGGGASYTGSSAMRR